MRTSRFSSLLVAAALTGGSAIVAFPQGAAAEPIAARSTVAQTPASAPVADPAATTDAEQYTAREAKDKAVANFRGGSRVVLVSGSLLTVVLIVVLVVILL